MLTSAIDILSKALSANCRNRTKPRQSKLTHHAFQHHHHGNPSPPQPTHRQCRPNRLRDLSSRLRLRRDGLLWCSWLHLGCHNRQSSCCHPDLQHSLRHLLCCLCGRRVGPNPLRWDAEMWRERRMVWRSKERNELREMRTEV